ncbi:hypothetical protein F0249_19145 [Vibrio sp. 03-59-1]|uniref:hypothetical protein n=1 Tax=Vibrio sp. 03-59-1 TaxID=2607607 RepID=UPI001493DD97|nr:hypothetical protein [Vibrio sp. 03-59-1]NOH85906.1 hypothetical protein [Vibrio sp. 03-59-1]
MFGPIGGGLTNGNGSPISPSATMGETKSGANSTTDFRTGDINMGGGVSNTTLIIGAVVALGVLYMLKK